MRRSTAAPGQTNPLKRKAYFPSSELLKSFHPLWVSSMIETNNAGEQNDHEVEGDHAAAGELAARAVRRGRRGEGQGQGRLHRPAHRRRLGQRPRRPQLGRSRGASCAMPTPRRSTNTSWSCSTTSASRTWRCRSPPRWRPTRRSSPAATHYCSVDRDRDGRHLSQVRPAGDRLGRGAARHHLPQQVCRDPSRQRHDDQPERRQCRADLQARLQDLRGDPRHHRLRQGPQPVFQRGARQDRRQDRRHLRRHRRPAGLHRRAHPDQGAQSGGDLFRRADADRRAHPLADGQARHQGGVRRHLRHRVRRLHPGPRPAGRGRAGVPRGRADREAARRQVLHGEVRRPEIRQPAGGLRRLRLRRDGPDPRHASRRSVPTARRSSPSWPT